MIVLATINSRRGLSHVSFINQWIISHILQSAWFDDDNTISQQPQQKTSCQHHTDKFHTTNTGRHQIRRLKFTDKMSSKGKCHIKCEENKKWENSVFQRRNPRHYSNMIDQNTRYKRKEKETSSHKQQFFQKLILTHPRQFFCIPQPAQSQSTQSQNQHFLSQPKPWNFDTKFKCDKSLHHKLQQKTYKKNHENDSQTTQNIKLLCLIIHLFNHIIYHPHSKSYKERLGTFREKIKILPQTTNIPLSCIKLIKQKDQNNQGQQSLQQPSFHHHCPFLFTFIFKSMVKGGYRKQFLTIDFFPKNLQCTRTNFQSKEKEQKQKRQNNTHSHIEQIDQ